MNFAWFALGMTAGLITYSVALRWALGVEGVNMVKEYLKEKEDEHTS